MRNFLKKNNQTFVLILSFFFFGSLILFSNDFNSKIIILFVAYSIFSFFYFGSKQRFIKVISFYTPMLFLFGLLLLSLFYSKGLKTGLGRIQHVIPLAVFPIMFSLLKIRRLTIHKILRFFPFVVLAACLYSHTVTIIRFISNNEPSLRHFFNLNYSYGALGNTLDLHTTYYSIYILFAITIILENFKNLKSIIHKILYLLLIGYFSSFILQLASRVSIVTLYLIFLFFSIRFIYEKRQIMKGIFVIIVFHVLLFIIGSNMSITKYRFQHIFGFTYYTGYTVNDGQHKLNLWTAAINANDNLLIGNGVGDIQPSLNASYKENGLTKPLKENYNSHNQYIEFYVGLGIIGLLFFLYLLFYYGYLFLKTKNYLGVQFIILIAIISFTECIWNRHNGIVFICFLIGLLVGQSLSLDEDSDRPRLSF